MFWKDSGGGLWKFWSENKVLWTFVRLGYHSTVDLLGCAASRQSIEERDMQREMESTLCLPGEILRRDAQWGRWDGKWDGDWLGLATTELQHAGGVWSPSVTCRTAVTFNLSFSCQIKPLLSLSLSSLQHFYAIRFCMKQEKKSKQLWDLTTNFGEKHSNKNVWYLQSDTDRER